MLLPEGEWY